MKLYQNTILLLFIAMLSACSKDWLDKKPIDSQVVPTTVADAMALLDDNATFNAIVPMAETSADNYYLTNSVWNSLAVLAYKNAYVWNSDIWAGADQSDWSRAYNKIFIANIALETIEKNANGNINQSEFNTAKGTGLFARAHAIFDIANLYCKPYNASSATTDPGIPLKLTSNVNEAVGRGTVQQTYDKMLSDLKQAIQLLPTVPRYRTRGAKPAAYALVARIYLNMQDYNKAALYADSCLQLNNSLIDYNTISTTATTPFVRDNLETIYYSASQNWDNVRANILLVDPQLYASYDNNDLRKVIFFVAGGGDMTRKSGYTGNTVLFAGIATDEVYLIRAECYARTNRVNLALNDLNALLIKRFKTSTFVPFSGLSADDALALILKERRKELVYRNIRWMDLRRLNLDSRFAVTLTRNVNNVTYTLAPNSDRYTFALPEIEITKYGFEQNKR